MEKFSKQDIEFLNQGELFYSGGQYTWSDQKWDEYRKGFEAKFGNVTNYMKSLKQGEHVSHRASGRFALTKTAITHQYAERCHEIMDQSSPDVYWMYKYDGCSLVAYYSNGKLVQVCTKSAVEWGIDRTGTLGWLFPEYVSEDIDSIQGEAVVKVSEVGGEYAARSKANGLINSKYKADEIRKLIHLRAFKVGFVDLDESIPRMIDALTKLPIPEHGRFQIAKRITKADVTDSAVGSEDILYDGIVKYGEGEILGYKRHSDEHLLTKVVNIEWNRSSKGLMVPKFVFENVVFNAVYDDEGKCIGGINVCKASCGSANRLFSMGGGVGAIVEVYRANSTIPQVSRVIQKSSDYCLGWLDDRYYEENYEFNYLSDPWKVIDNKGYYPFGGGIRNGDGNQGLNLRQNIEYWYGIDNWKKLQDENPHEFLKFIYYKTNLKGTLNSIDKANLSWFAWEIMSGNPAKFDEFTNNIISWTGCEQFRNSMFSIKDEFLEFIKSLTA